MDLVFQAIVIGIVQGLTEFLPVSSSAHLILIPPLLGWDDPFINSAAFDVMLHMGTLLALVVYFWRDVLADRRRRRVDPRALHRRRPGPPAGVAAALSRCSRPRFSAFLLKASSTPISASRRLVAGS